MALFCCQNPACADYGLRGRDNLRVGFRYGKQRRRMLVCRTCQARFSERKGTALFAARLPEGQALAVFQHLQDGCGVHAGCAGWPGPPFGYTALVGSPGAVDGGGPYTGGRTGPVGY